MPKANILIAEDDLMIQVVIEEYLENEDYELTFADDGELAWQQLQDLSLSFDVVILDRKMPKMNGLDLLKLIKQDDRLKNIPVILQTGMKEKADIVEGLEAGAFYYLTKPFDESVLLSVVHTAVDDSLRYKEFAQRIEETQKTSEASINLIQDATYHYRTLDEAKSMAALLSNASSTPGTTILGLSELLINAVEHGNLGITYDEKSELNNNNSWSLEVEKRLNLEPYKNRFVTVKLHRSEQGLEVNIIDCGDGFDWQQYMEFSVERAGDNHGRGIALANQLGFKTLSCLGKGNEVYIII